MNEEVLIQKEEYYIIIQIEVKFISLKGTIFYIYKVKFTEDYLMKELNGLSYDLFIFNKLFLEGGNN